MDDTQKMARDLNKATILRHSTVAQSMMLAKRSLFYQRTRKGKRKKNAFHSQSRAERIGLFALSNH
jgi:hypothetical protein